MELISSAGKKGTEQSLFFSTCDKLLKVTSISNKNQPWNILHNFQYISLKGTSSAVLVIESNPIYEKKTTADPANIPFTPKGKYLQEHEKVETKGCVL